MHVGFIHIPLPMFLTNGLVDVLLFEVGYIYLSVLVCSTTMSGISVCISEVGKVSVSWSQWMADSYCCRLPQDTAPDPS